LQARNKETGRYAFIALRFTLAGSMFVVLRLSRSRPTSRPLELSAYDIKRNPVVSRRIYHLAFSMLFDNFNLRRARRWP